MTRAMTMVLGMTLMIGAAGAQLGTPRIEAGQRLIEQRLRARRISLSFERAPLTDVARVMGKLCGVDLVVDPELLRERDEDELRVTLTARDLRADNALALLLEMSDLTRVYRAGALLITGRDLRVEQTYLVVYDVRDMMRELRDFKGPRIGIAAPTYGGSVGCYFGGGEEEARNELTSPDVVVELVRANVGGTSWDDNDEVGVSIASGHLIVRQTCSAHRELRGFLRRLRLFR